MGASIKVFADHKNLTRDAMGLTSNRVYQLRLLLEEYTPEILYIKEIHSTVADAISWLEYNPKLNTTNEYTHATLGVSSEEMSAKRWKSLLHHWQSYNESKASKQAHCAPMSRVQIAARRKNYTLSQQWILPRLNKTMQPWSTSLSAMQLLIEDWRSNSLRTLLVYAKIDG